MFNHQLSLKKFFTAFIPVLASIIVPEIAMSNPTLIVPSNQYRENGYIMNGRGNAYDFCFDNKTFGYIVVSEATSERLERRYPIRFNCAIPTTSTTGSKTFSQFGSSSFPSSSNDSLNFYSNNTSGRREVSSCRPGCKENKNGDCYPERKNSGIYCGRR
jgi:hypothetical protein